MWKLVTQVTRNVVIKHLYLRSSTEFCRDIMITSRSPSPVPQTINNFNRDMIAETEEKIHTSRMKTMLFLVKLDFKPLICDTI